MTTTTGAARPYGLARHSLALAGRSLTKTRRNPGILLDALFLPVVFLLLFVYLFGGAVAGSTRDYLQYIFPGVLMMAMIMTGMLATGVNLNYDIKKGVFDRFRSLPIGRSAPLVGLVVGDLIRYAVALATLFGLGYLLGFRIGGCGPTSRPWSWPTWPATTWWRSLILLTAASTGSVGRSGWSGGSWPIPTWRSTIHHPTSENLNSDHSLRVEQDPVMRLIAN